MRLIAGDIVGAAVVVAVAVAVDVAITVSRVCARVNKGNLFLCDARQPQIQQQQWQWQQQLQGRWQRQRQPLLLQYIHPPPQLPMPHVAGLSFHALLLAASQAGRVFLSRVFF